MFGDLERTTCTTSFRRVSKQDGDSSIIRHLGEEREGQDVFEPLDFEAILVVDGGEVFEQLGGLQRVRCHEHIDVGVGTVNL